MITLAIECATKTAGAALLSDEETLGAIFLGAGRHHAEVLLPAVETLFNLTKMTIQDVELFACTTGPGSFTGVRMGIATVKGLALATGKPAVGVSTLETMAMNLRYSKRLVCPLLDARKNQVYAGLYRMGADGLPEPLIADQLADILDVLKDIPCQDVDFIGDGASRYSKLIREFVPASSIFDNSRLSNPDPSALGLAAIRRYRRDGLADSVLSLLPSYLRLSEAEQKAGRDRVAAPDAYSHR
jgi:tRNA threonylcarbamoyladenosine biosynthesis protein TsaB